MTGSLRVLFFTVREHICVLSGSSYFQPVTLASPRLATTSRRESAGEPGRALPPPPGSLGNVNARRHAADEQHQDRADPTGGAAAKEEEGAAESGRQLLQGAPRERRRHACRGDEVPAGAHADAPRDQRDAARARGGGGATEQRVDPRRRPAAAHRAAPPLRVRRPGAAELLAARCPSPARHARRARPRTRPRAHLCLLVAHGALPTIAPPLTLRCDGVCTHLAVRRSPRCAAVRSAWTSASTT